MSICLLKSEFSRLGFRLDIYNIYKDTKSYLSARILSIFPGFLASTCKSCRLPGKYMGTKFIRAASGSITRRIWMDRGRKPMETKVDPAT